VSSMDETLSSGRNIKVGKSNRNSAWLVRLGDDSCEEMEHVHSAACRECLEPDAIGHPGIAEETLCIGQADPEQQGSEAQQELEFTIQEVISGRMLRAPENIRATKRRHEWPRLDMVEMLTHLRAKCEG
jgi:hypothetical protein